MKRLIFLLILIISCSCVGLFSQNAAFMDKLLVSKAINQGQASYLVLSAAGISQETDSPAVCLAKAQELKWVDKSVTETQTISLSEYSYLIMRAFKMTGGMFYTIFPGSRYAYREFIYKGIVSGATPQDAALSGPESVRILSQIMEQTK